MRGRLLRYEGARAQVRTSSLEIQPLKSGKDRATPEEPTWIGRTRPMLQLGSSQPPFEMPCLALGLDP